MKMGILLLLLLPGFAYAQTIALLDRAFKNPVTVTETVTSQQLSGKWFPVYIADFENVIRLTERLVRSINNRTLPSSGTQVLGVGHSRVAITAHGTGVHTTYSIFLSTRSGNIGASLQLVKRDEGNRKAVQELLLFLDYLKNNRHMLESEKRAGA